MEVRVLPSASAWRFDLAGAQRRGPGPAARLSVPTVRLLLDANLSPAAAGHDVLALAVDPALEGLDDPLVLELAAAERRVLITRNSRDFAPLAREWAEASRHHAG